MEPATMEWISVNERLPDSVDDVLVWNGQKVAIAFRTLSAGWLSLAMNDDEVEAISHWMPLPQPPKQ